MVTERTMRQKLLRRVVAWRVPQRVVEGVRCDVDRTDRRLRLQKNTIPRPVPRVHVRQPERKVQARVV